jgi:hypothetical protein
MTTIIVTFNLDNSATILWTDTENTYIRRTTHAIDAMKWMTKQGLEFTWTKTADGLEQAVWEKAQ